MTASAQTSGKHTIAIIGAGYSGALTAVNILRNNPPASQRVVLIEKESVVGRGLAYRCWDDNLLLNVPAGNMSALADEPDHFVSYCEDIDPAFNAKSFVPRRLYGDYLEHTLTEAELSHPGILEKLAGEAVAVIPDVIQKRYRIELASGASLEAQQVVLALGHFPPEPPIWARGHLCQYIVDPWDFPRLDCLPPHMPVAIIGMGLTAIDAVFRLTSWNKNRKIYLLSRRGLLPHSHRFNPKPPPPSNYPDYLVGQPASIRAYTRALRLEVARREAAGGDWRDVMNELRPHTPRLWQALPESEQRRFLERIVPFWDIHRHRLAPSAAHRLAGLLDSGQVERIAGRILDFGLKGSHPSIRFKQRGNERIMDLSVGATVNCTGPNYDLSRLSHPLIIRLREDGLVQQDRLKLGMLLDSNYRLIDRNNQPTPGLFYIGPMLRAKYWEAIAVPELRNHARRLARILMCIEN